MKQVVMETLIVDGIAVDIVIIAVMGIVETAGNKGCVKP